MGKCHESIRGQLDTLSAPGPTALGESTHHFPLHLFFWRQLCTTYNSKTWVDGLKRSKSKSERMIAIWRYPRGFQIDRPIAFFCLETTVPHRRNLYVKFRTV